MDITGLLGNAKVVSTVTNPVVEITPKMAESLLQRNHNNRKLRQYKVDQYADAMDRGDWKIREPLEFDPQGNMLNGQHRLSAVVKVGKPIRMAIATDVHRDEIVVMDTGLSRQASDVLAMDGVKDATQVASTAKIIHLWRTLPGMTMLRANSKKLNNQTIEELVRNEPGIIDAVATAKQASKYFNLIPPSAMAAMFYELSNKHGDEKVKEFFQGLTFGIGLEEGDAILALRSVLLKSQTAYTKPPTELRIAWTVVAFHKWMKGEKAKLIKHMKNSPYPTP